MSQPSQRVSRATRRQQILDAATRVFGSKGTSAGTLQEIADQVGITRAGVLHHFGSKENLLQAVLEYRDRSDVAELPEQHVPQGADWFHHLVHTAVENTQRPGIVQAYVVLSSEAVTEGHPATPFFQHRYSALREEGVAAIRETWPHADLDPEKVELAAACIPAIMDGLQVQWLLDPERVDLAQATAFCFEALLSAVLPSDAEPLELPVTPS